MPEPVPALLLQAVEAMAAELKSHAAQGHSLGALVLESVGLGFERESGWFVVISISATDGANPESEEFETAKEVLLGRLRPLVPAPSNVRVQLASRAVSGPIHIDRDQ